MANQYSQVFSLQNLISDKQFKKVLPYISYKETEGENGKLSQRTQVLTVRHQIFDTAISTAKVFYNNLTTARTENQLILDGELEFDHDQVVDAVYTSIKRIRPMLIWTANTSNMLRYALKEAGRNKHNFGIDSKLYLRAQSAEEIKGMSRAQAQELLSNIVDNIVYGDNFPETQKKFMVDKIAGRGKYTYEQERENWKRKVGAL